MLGIRILKKEQAILACFYYHFFMVLAIYLKKKRFKVACNLLLVACSTSKVQARSSVVMLLYLALNTQIVPYSFFNIFCGIFFFVGGLTRVFNNG